LRPNTHISWLQWGRDQLIAEFPDLTAAAIMDVALQWGRDQLIAEFRAWHCTMYRRWPASMGPRSIDRGITGGGDEIATLHNASMGPRSIDRGIGVAEHALLPIAFGFNGAAIN